MMCIKGLIMLSYFRIQNFKSILDLTLNLSFAEGKAPANYANLPFLPFVGAQNDTKARYVPVMALYGANASGKTNILQALFVLKRLLVFGVEKNYHPNRLNPKYNTTSFEIGVFVNDVHYDYYVEYNQNGIQHEILYKDNKAHVVFEIEKHECFFDNIATAEYTDLRLKEIYKVECLNEQQQQVIPFLAKIAKNYTGLNLDIVAVRNALIQQIEVYPENNIPLSFVLDKLVREKSVENLTEAFDNITSILKKLDIDINKLTFDRKRKPIIDRNNVFGVMDENTTFYMPTDKDVIIDSIKSYHTDINGNEVVFNFNEESEGTVTLSGIIGMCLSALAKGNVLCVDELDKSLHSKLLIEIVKLFKDKRYNKHNAQLVFTAHNTDILDNDIMRISEVGVVDKTEKNGTAMKRVSDFDGKRNVTNFRKQYLDGVFSGIPYPYI